MLRNNLIHIYQLFGEITDQNIDVYMFLGHFCPNDSNKLYMSFCQQCFQKVINNYIKLNKGYFVPVNISYNDVILCIHIFLIDGCVLVVKDADSRSILGYNSMSQSFCLVTIDLIKIDELKIYNNKAKSVEFIIQPLVTINFEEESIFPDEESQKVIKSKVNLGDIKTHLWEMFNVPTDKTILTFQNDIPPYITKFCSVYSPNQRKIDFNLKLLPVCKIEQKYNLLKREQQFNLFILLYILSNNSDETHFNYFDIHFLQSTNSVRTNNDNPFDFKWFKYGLTQRLEKNNVVPEKYQNVEDEETIKGSILKNLKRNQMFNISIKSAESESKIYPVLDISSYLRFDLLNNYKNKLVNPALSHQQLYLLSPNEIKDFLDPLNKTNLLNYDSDLTNPNHISGKITFSGRVYNYLTVKCLVITIICAIFFVFFYIAIITYSRHITFKNNLVIKEACT
ncbi:hypothetical protein NUSPORA_01127 [Nucleospora cyclopteri]